MSPSKRPVEEGERFQKRPCLSGGSDPNVTIAFEKNGDTVKAHSVFLRSFSDYFDAGLRTMERHGKSDYEFRFDESWCADEFRWFLSLMYPQAGQKVDEDTLDVAVRWARYLQCNRCLEVCDEILQDDEDRVPSMGDQDFLSEQETVVAVGTLIWCTPFNLKQSQSQCMKLIEKTILNNPTVVKLEQVKELLKLVKDHGPSMESLLDALTNGLPESYTLEKKHSLIEHSAFVEIVCVAFEMSVAAKIKEQKWDKASKTTLELVAIAKEQHHSKKALQSLATKLRDDASIWGQLISDAWLEKIFTSPHAFYHSDLEE